DYNIIDRVIEEDISFSIEGFHENFSRLKKAIVEEFNILMKKSPDELVSQRQEKYRKIGGGF
ncbi:MAG: acetyl-CoA carboxylase carboxyl transferase subunit alpha, partial [Tissierellia bacterium]|nr:acetyl-CoA carboxylase carboxyl transferase subunit alpha [Tissierellia bacterium]